MIHRFHLVPLAAALPAARAIPAVVIAAAAAAALIAAEAAAAILLGEAVLLLGGENLAEVLDGGVVELALLPAQLAEGVLAPLISYPGGPAATYFRLSVTSEHTTDQIDRLVSALARHLEPGRPARIAG